MIILILNAATIFTLFTKDEKYDQQPNKMGAQIPRMRGLILPEWGAT